jgi:hypothetical protein
MHSTEIIETSKADRSYAPAGVALMRVARPNRSNRDAKAIKFGDGGATSQSTNSLEVAPIG